MWWNYLIEALFSIGMVVNAALFIPQALKLYRTKNPESLSLLTFAGFNVIQFFTIAHGYLAKDYLLIIGNILNMVTSGAITVLILIYKMR